MNIIWIFGYYSPKSFDDLESWLKDLKDNANPDLKIFLIANKNDLEDCRLISKEEGKQFQEDSNLDFFMETSMKDENKAQEIFIEAAKFLYSDYLKSSDHTKQKDCLIY